MQAGERNNREMEKQKIRFLASGGCGNPLGFLGCFALVFAGREICRAFVG